MQQERCYKSNLAAGWEIRSERVVVWVGGVYDEQRFLWTGGGEAGQTTGTAGQATALGEEAAEGICGAEGGIKVWSVTTKMGGENI